MQVEPLNRVRLHSALGYVTPLAKLEGREPQIFAERDRKLEEARRQRQLRRQTTSSPLPTGLVGPVTTVGKVSAVGLN